MALTPGTGMLSAEEDRRNQTNYIFQYIQALINSPGVSDAQKNAGLQRLQQMGVPSFIIQQGIEAGRGGAIRGIPAADPAADPRGPTATDIRARAPSMRAYGDVRSVLAPGTSNIRVDQPDIGWPGEDFRGFKPTPTRASVSVVDDFSSTPALPVNPFAFEDTKARAPRAEYQGSSGGLGNTRAMQEKAAFMAAAPTPVRGGDRHPPVPAPDPFAFEDRSSLFNSGRTPFLPPTQPRFNQYQTPSQPRFGGQQFSQPVMGRPLRGPH